MRRIIYSVSLAFCYFASTPALAGSWDAVLKGTLRVPTEDFIYGYSEFTPAYPQGVRAYEPALDDTATILQGDHYTEFVLRAGAGKADRFGVPLYEELRHVRPGLRYLAEHWLADMRQLVRGDRPGGNTLKGIPATYVRENPYWPSDIPKFPNRPVVSLTPLAMTRINEDLGRTRPWAVYGATELDWEEAFWRAAPAGTGWLCRLLSGAYGENAGENCDPKALGVRILTEHPERVPRALGGLVLPAGARSAAGVRYLVTFLPYGGAKWPAALKTAYARGGFDAIPSPATLLFSGVPLFEGMGNPQARQLALLTELSQFSRGLARLTGLRALDVSRKRHRFQKDADEETKPAPIGSRGVGGEAEDVFPEIFDATTETVGLYGKPIARNVQMWGFQGPLAAQKWFFDGPSATRTAIDRARATLQADAKRSHVHYRNYYPPMDINGYEAWWVRPLVAWAKPGDDGEIAVDVLHQGAVRLVKRNAEQWFPVDWNDRSGADEALTHLVDSKAAIAKLSDKRAKKETTALNARKLFEFSRLMPGKKLTVDVATALVNPANETTYAEWLGNLEAAVDAGIQKPEERRAVAANVRSALSRVVDTSKVLAPIAPHTYRSTVDDRFDRSYWDKLVALTERGLVAKNNIDCAEKSDPGKGIDEHCKRNHLPGVLDYLKRYYENELGLTTYVHEFEWKMDFDLPWWLNGEGLKVKQQNLIAVVHGTDNRPHDEAVIMGDHYDTAEMGDIFDGKIYAENERDVPELKGHRHASMGADDNHSATVALMEAARALKGLHLKRDVWITHITGEEFPADGLGSRALAQALIEGKALTGRPNPRITGVYVLDMVGHSTDRDQKGVARDRVVDAFQIAPGRGERSARLALHAHRATAAWNRLLVAEDWNGPAKLNRTRAWERQPAPGGHLAKLALPFVPKLTAVRGEIRPGWHVRSSLYQTDIQIFADAGFPAVLFMENYDVNRVGYHDTLDNMGNIDLDYARAVSAISIETVAQAAME